MRDWGIIIEDVAGCELRVKGSIGFQASQLAGTQTFQFVSLIPCGHARRLNG